MEVFNKEIDKIVIAHYGNVVMYPPVISVIRYLLDNGYKVVLISGNTGGLPEVIRNNPFFQANEIKVLNGRRVIDRLKRRFLIGAEYRSSMKSAMNENDVLWTTTDLTVRILNDTLIAYKKHVMQMMEMVEWMPMFEGAKILKFDIKKYANSAWKTVVPEINRAYITKAMWNMKKLPIVLPNKPYSLACDYCSNETSAALEVIKKEKRKIILYLGIIGIDRDLTTYAEAVEMMGNDYCLYIIGNVGDQVKGKFDEFLYRYKNVIYLGYFPAPQHLLFLEYAYIGLLPYTTSFNFGNANPLNVLYCAPNKIFEYAGYGVPMVGSDLMGLKVPFEQYKIGVCCNQDESKDIKRALEYVSERHDIMSSNCKMYYNSVDIGKIIEEIINN